MNTIKNFNTLKFGILNFSIHNCIITSGAKKVEKKGFKNIEDLGGFSQW
ncbi:hypothetical protein CM15mP35_05840 [bacterium]|nr:MAG: hypothetical protein CM15mP35_05840 [bacterium]